MTIYDEVIDDLKKKVLSQLENTRSGTSTSHKKFSAPADTKTLNKLISDTEFDKQCDPNGKDERIIQSLHKRIIDAYLVLNEHSANLSPSEKLLHNVLENLIDEVGKVLTEKIVLKSKSL